MKLQQRRELPLPRQTVREALDDPAVPGVCIRGCASFDRNGRETRESVVEVKIVSVSTRFKGTVALNEPNPFESCSMSFQGRGGQAGFVKGPAGGTPRETARGCRVGSGADRVRRAS